MSTEHSKLLLGVDWGTSNRRAYLVERGGGLLARHADDQGLLAIGGQFEASMAALRQRFGIGREVPAIMSGMVGSASGWQEVPYLDTAVPISELPAHLLTVPGYPECSIVPGYCARQHGVDVMRGEETQLLGALAQGLGDGWVVLPGTHSKWVLLQGGKVARLSTFMTGELYSMLSASGTLAPVMAQGGDDAAAFAAGMDEAQEGRPLSNTLFGVRARVVSGAMPAVHAASWVSGLLIGTEFCMARRHAGGALSLIGSSALTSRYRIAADHFSLQAQVLDPDAVYLAALQQFFQ